MGDKRSALVDLPFLVLQGSCAGSTLYSAYASTVREMIQEPLSQPVGTTNQNLAPELDSNWQLSSRRPIDLHSFADNHAYKKGFPGNSRECEVKTIKCVTHQININGVSVQSVDAIRYLGAWMDKHLSLKHHVKVKCKAAMFNLIRIKEIKITPHRIHVQHPGHESCDVAHCLCK